jgi:hypothetical protein
MFRHRKILGLKMPMRKESGRSDDIRGRIYAPHKEPQKPLDLIFLLSSWYYFWYLVPSLALMCCLWPSIASGISLSWKSLTNPESPTSWLLYFTNY